MTHTLTKEQISKLLKRKEEVKANTPYVQIVETLLHIKRNTFEKHIHT